VIVGDHPVPLISSFGLVDLAATSATSIATPGFSPNVADSSMEIAAGSSPRAGP
jgi:hypothetical protein